MLRANSDPGINNPAYVPRAMYNPLNVHREAGNGQLIVRNEIRQPALPHRFLIAAADLMGRLIADGYDATWNYVCDLLINLGLYHTDEAYSRASSELSFITAQPDISTGEARERLRAANADERHHFDIECQRQKLPVEINKIRIDTNFVNAGIDKIDADIRKIDVDCHLGAVNACKLKEEIRGLEIGNDIAQAEICNKQLKITVEKLCMEKEYAKLLEANINIMDAYGYLCSKTIGQQITPKHEAICANIISGYFAKTRVTDNWLILQCTKILLAMYSMDKTYAMTSYFNWNKNEIDPICDDKIESLAGETHKPWKIFKHINRLNLLRAGQFKRSIFCGLWKKNYKLESF